MNSSNQDLEKVRLPQFSQPASAEETYEPGVEEHQIRLLEEKVLVDLSTRKLGEIVVRKVIVTETIEVPVQREQLIIEEVEAAPDDISQTSTNAHTGAQVDNRPLELKPEADRIYLLEERLVVDRTRRKIGEIVARKVLETEIVQIPVRREKIIIEQVGDQTRQLAEIDLKSGVVNSAQSEVGLKSQAQNPLTVTAEFSSPQTANLILNAIASQPQHRCRHVRVELVVEDEETRQTYQDWCDRYSNA